MIRPLELRRRLRHIAPNLIGACVFGYFAYHAVQGDRGIVAWLRIDNQLAESEATLAGLVAEHEKIEHRVALLSPRSLDPDMLEERARIMLNSADPNDRLIILSDPAATR